MKIVSHPQFAFLGISAFILLLLSGCASQKPYNPNSNSTTTASDPIIEITHATKESQPQYVARLHTELATGYYLRKQYQIALEEINEALRNDKQYAPAYGVMALIHAKLGDHKGAENAFLQAIQVSPNDPDIRNNFGAFLCERNRFKESLGQFDHALRNPLYQTPQMALQNAAECALKGKEIPLARHYYQQLGRPFPEELSNPAPSTAPRLFIPAAKNKTSSTIQTEPASAFEKGQEAYKNGDLINAQLHIQRALKETNSPTPTLLHTALCIERRFANVEEEERYADLLLSQHGHSYEALSLNTPDRGCS